MILYHGTNARLQVGAQLRTPTGAECWDCVHGGVVYLATTPEAAARYGTVYAVCVTCARTYAHQRMLQNLPAKKGRYVRGVMVALGSATMIVRKV